MSFVRFATPVLVGVLAGLLVGLVRRRGGYGLGWDMILGLAGSTAIRSIFDATGLLPSPGLGVVVIIAFIGAAIPVVAQRQVWPTAA